MTEEYQNLARKIELYGKQYRFLYEPLLAERLEALEAKIKQETHIQDTQIRETPEK